MVTAVHEPSWVTERPAVVATAGAPGDWLGPSRFALLLGLLIFAAFPQVILGLETFVVRDYGFFAYPLAHYQRECFWRGQLPLWNPYNNCGVPFLAQWNTMALYPPALVYLLFPLKWSLSFFCLLHLFWAGLGMYSLAYRWTRSRWAAAVAGLIFSFNGFSLNLLMWPSHIATFSWMPWVLLLVEQGWRRGGRSLVLAAAAGAFQMLAGGPETILFTWLLLTALWGIELFDAWRRARTGASSRSAGTEAGMSPRLLALLQRFPAMVLLVAGLTAVQLLPFLDLAAHSQRQTGFADARWSMPSWGWANFLVPMVFGTHGKQDLFFQYGQYWTSSYYLGIGALLLGGFALWTVRNRRVRFLALVATTGIVLAGGNNNFLSRALRHALPQLTLMTYPVKYVALTVVSVPLLAAFGIASASRLPRKLRARTTGHWLLLCATLLLLIGGILFVAWQRPFPTDDFSATLRNGLSRAGLLVLELALLLWLFRTSNLALLRLLPLALLLVFWVDVWTHEPPQNPTVPPQIVYQPYLARKYLGMQPQPSLGGSRAMVAPAAAAKFTQMALNDSKANYLAKRLGYFADCNVLDDVPKVDGFFSLSPRESGELDSILYLQVKPCPPRLADFLSVSQVSVPPDYTKWQPRDSFLPLATGGQRPLFLDETNALFALLDPRFDPRAYVLLPPSAKSLISVTNATQVQVKLARVTAQRVELDVDAAADCMVVLAQTYYHPWQAQIDGHPAHLLRANYAFDALQVPSGKHHVRLVYRDRALVWGAAISGLTLLLSMVVVVGLKGRSGYDRPLAPSDPL